MTVQAPASTAYYKRSEGTTMLQYDVCIGGRKGESGIGIGLDRQTRTNTRRVLVVVPLRVFACAS